MKFELKIHREWVTNVSDEELIRDVQNVAKTLNKDTVTCAEYKESGKFNSEALRKRLGTWSQILELAHLPRPKRKDCISEEELFANLEEVWTKLGRQPGRREMVQPLSQYSERPYQDRFGSWVKALKRFVKYINDNSDNVADNRSGTCQDPKRFSS